MLQPVQYMMHLYRKTKMAKLKRLLLIGIAIVLCTQLWACAASSSSKDNEDESANAVFDFYKLDDSEKILWIELPITDTGYTWKYVISDEEVLKAQSSSVVEDKTGNDENETSGVWIASFANASTNYGDIKMELYYLEASEKVGETEPVYTMYLNVAADKAITVKSITE